MDAGISNLLAWCAANIGHFAYSENGGRLDPDSSGYTDCSGLTRYLYRKFCNITPGSYTGDECNYGQLVTSSKTDARTGKGLLPGDAIFYRWENRPLGSDPWDHTNIYGGADLVYNHGGPGRGPVKQSLQHNVDSAVAVMVRRFIPATAESSEDDMALDPKDPVIVALNAKVDGLAARMTTLAQIEIWGDKTHPDSIHSIGLQVKAIADAVGKLSAGGASAAEVASHLQLTVKP